jgi:DNA-binding GntR family transcriptional regulator
MSKKTDIAYNVIKQNIVDGIYKPSQKLIESTLSESIGVSRNTVKKALLKLEQENLLVIEDNKGATVKSYSLEEVIHCLEILEVLEGLAVKSAVHHISESELNKLENIINNMELLVLQNKFEDFGLLSMQFRSIIYNVAKNQQAVELIEHIRTPLRRYQFRTLLLPEIKENSIINHKEIYEALRKGDENLAEDSIRSELVAVRQIISKNYQLLF